MKVGIIGLGRVGKIHLENCSSKLKGVEVAAAMNPSERGQKFAEAWGVPMVTDDALELINHPEIEAVLVCSTTESHAEYVEAAAKAGKAIFCEKPLDLSIERVESTLGLIKEYNTPLMLAFNQRFDPHFSAVKQQVMEGNIGQCHSLHIISRDPAPPPISYIHSSGGMFMDMTIHDFDMARYLMECEVTEVFAKGHNLLDPAIGEAGDIDTAVVVLTFENKATAIIENSRKAVYGYDQRLEVFGSKGMIRTENPLKTTNLFFGEKGGSFSRNLDFFMDRYSESYLLELKAFFEALKNSQPMPVNGEDGLKAMQIAAAANQSMKEGRAIKM